MCGIVVANVEITKAIRALSHRGIRSTVCECGSGIQFGHVRLPIVGISVDWDQPVRTNGATLAFVGEVLDFREHDPDLKCDLSLVRRTWAKRGAAGFKKFDGFWSVVVVDDDGPIHLLVDYLCQKPLYYRSDAQVIAAASEPDALCTLASTTPDELYLSAVIKFGYCPEPHRTPYAEIKKALPGEHIVLYPNEPGRIDRTIVDSLTPTKMSSGMLKNEIEAAVRRRVLSSDVPVACLLSGGLDSSIVYTLAKRYGDVRPYFADSGDVAEQVAASAVAAPRVPTKVQWGDVPLAKALEYMQEPLDLGSLVPQCALSDAIGAAGGERVCLTGDGADELLGGYGRAMRYDSQASDVFHELVCWHLPRLDRTMMRNRIEVRSPFLSRRVAGLALGLPRELRTGKKVLKDIFRGELPRGIADQEKKPLRTTEVAEDREGRSRELVEMFRKAKFR